MFRCAYAELSKLFGNDGIVGSICANDAGDLPVRLCKFWDCPSSVVFSAPPRDPALIALLVNDSPMPRYLCEMPDTLRACHGPSDTASCAGDRCLPSFTYRPPTADAPGGSIELSEMLDLCHSCAFRKPEGTRIEIDYVE